MSDNKKISILIVDDQRITRLGLRTVLEALPDFILIGEAENGETALKLAKELAPNIVLMDLCMPGLSGIAAIKLIKEAAPQVRIIVITESTDDDDALAALAAGADAYCLKDFNADQLALIIRAVHHGIACLYPAKNRKLLALRIAEAAIEYRNKQDQN